VNEVPIVFNGNSVAEIILPENTEFDKLINEQIALLIKGTVNSDEPYDSLIVAAKSELS